MDKQQLLEPERPLICELHDCNAAEPRTYYVHLHDGHVDTVADVTGLEVTDIAIVFEREAGVGVTYARRDVFYTCCDQDAQPPSLF